LSRPSLLESSQAFLGIKNAQRVLDSAKFTASRLAAQAKWESDNLATLHVRRAVVTAQRHSEELPGHEFSDLEDQAASEASLSQNAFGDLTRSCTRRGCSERGSCNVSSGACTCEQGWMGKLCEEQECSGNCSGRGLCIASKCVCSPESFGDACESLRCPSDCGGHGACFAGQCSCETGWGGLSCLVQLEDSSSSHPALLLSQRSQTASNAASCSGLCGHGQCQADGQCLCNQGWSGEGCDVESCPGGCSGTGMCHNGQCRCQQGFGGPDCSVSLASVHAAMRAQVCHNDCNGQGSCRAGVCQCYPGYSGLNCDVQDGPGVNPSGKLPLEVGDEAREQRAGTAQTYAQASSPLTATWIQPPPPNHDVLHPPASDPPLPLNGGVAQPPRAATTEPLPAALSASVGVWDLQNLVNTPRTVPDAHLPATAALVGSPALSATQSLSPVLKGASSEHLLVAGPTRFSKQNMEV